jgi:hypothetical protein
MVSNMRAELAGIRDWPADGRFAPGDSAYQRRKAVLEDIRLSLEATYDFSSPAAAIYLTTIVLNVYDSSRARRKQDRTRAANVARRLLKDIPKRQRLMDELVP